METENDGKKTIAAEIKNDKDTLSKKELTWLKKLLDRQDHIDFITRSIVPEIEGLQSEKLSCFLAMFEDFPNKDNRKMNILLSGTNKVGLTIMLKWLSQIAGEQSFIESGDFKKDLIYGNIRKYGSKYLEFHKGVMIRQDQNVAIINDFEKMNKSQADKLYEVQKYQSIYIDQGPEQGNRYQTRTTIIAAATPKKGIVVKDHFLWPQFKIDWHVLQWFSFIWILENNQPSPNDISRINFFEEQNEVEDLPMDQWEIIPISFLKKWIHYAKKNINPKIKQSVLETFTEKYCLMRQKFNTKDGNMPNVMEAVTACRCAETSARMHLRDEISEEDRDIAFKLLNECWARRFSKEDIVENKEVPIKERSNQQIRELIIKNMKELTKKNDNEEFSMDELLDLTDKLNIDREIVTHFVDKLKREGRIYSPKGNFIKII